MGVEFAHLGLEEPAIRHLKRALDIDPFSEAAQSGFVQGQYLLGRFDEAVSAYLKFHVGRGSEWALLAKGRLDEAQPLIEEELAREPNSPYALGNWSRLLALRGRFREAEAAAPKVLENRVDRTFHHAAHDLAAVFALQGKAREAVHWLREASAAAMPNYLLFSRDPHLDRIRNDPEFIQFIAELKDRWERWRVEFR